MDAVSFFLVQHGSLHAAEVAGGRTYADSVFAGLTDAQMRTRAGKRLNSLAWLLWHMARVEDVVVNLVVADGRQVLDDGWALRLKVPYRHIGTGMTDHEAIELTAAIDIDALRAYRDVVGRRTREVVSALPEAAWEEIVGATDTGRAAAAGAFGPSTGWRADVGYTAWQDQSRAARLAGAAIRHNAMHMGEAITVRGQAGFGLGI